MYLNDAPTLGRIWKIYNLYMKAFPESERKPFSRILKKWKTGGTQLLSIDSDTGAFLGLAITICYEDRVLLDYFAIDEKQRGQGIGTEALKLLLSKHQGLRFVLEVETTKVPGPDRELRIRRKNFYKRNGLTELPIDVLLYGVEMEMLGNGCSMTFKEYCDILENEYGESVLPNIKELEIKECNDNRRE